MIHWSLLDKDGSEWEFKYETLYRPWLLRGTAIVFGLLSFLSFLGVICSMHGVPEGGSPYYLIVHGDQATAAGICIFILITLGEFI